jgi:protein TonB
MNYEIRAFRLSVILHAAVILLLIVAGKHFVSKQEKLLVVDFTISDSSEPHQALSMITPPNRKSGRRGIKIVKKEQELQVPETQQVARQEASPLQEARQVSPDSAQVPTVIENEKKVPENGGEKDAPGTISPHETGKSLASGGGINGTSAGNSDNSHSAAGIGYLKANFSYIRDMIMKRVIYPERAREMGWQGKVKVSFVISSDGLVKDIRILQSSGVDILDRNAVETIKKASPFPKPPVAAQLIIPISYKLR